MSKSKRELSTDEKKLWRRVAASLKTRRALPAEDIEEPAPSLKSVAKRTEKRPLVEPAPARNAPKVASPLPRRDTEKRVRRGKLEIGGSLDLHGHTQDSGRNALARFLQVAQARGDSVVIVITGAGRGGEGVLKRRLPEWLAERDLRPLTTGYAPAHRSHGGAGAFYVFIKRARETQS
ncbi:Smr/MutS family protein [Vitreimonas flagellata]|uniref:Smr/MutS family protein n=1 Tax=Vitreimonas flagellata TaxID=2560861 RepID=UPI001432205F|nr:Smr/MutS family protein [Vitreimonas flagellata]